MNIGDLFFTFRGDGAKLQVDAKTEGSKAGATIGQSLTAGIKQSFTGANLGKGLVQGLGLAGSLGAVNLVSNAVSGLTDVLQDSVKAAIADEESQNRLAASLRTNVAGWNGNTDSIEANILAKQRLGFQDETLRDSLTILVGATHDVAKAQAIQNTAMDLARFKGIDLKTASEALIKVEGGVYRSLKGLGIVLKDGATQTEALAAVQKVAAGQAEAYAQTNRGKLEASQIKLGEAMENFGGTIMPAVVAITAKASDLASDLAGNLEGLEKNAAGAAAILKTLGIDTGDAAEGGFDLVHSIQDLLAVGNPTKVSNTLGVLLDTIEKTGVSTAETRRQLNDFGLSVSGVASDLGGKAADDLYDFSTAVDHVDSSLTAVQQTVADSAGSAGFGAVGDAFGRAARFVINAARNMKTEVKKSNDAVVKSWDDMKKDVVADAESLISDAFDPIITADRLRATQSELAAQLRATQSELAAQRVIVASKTATKAEKRDALDRIHELTKDNAEYVLQLAQTGNTNTKAYAKGLKELKAEIAKAKGPAKAALQEVLDKIHEIERDGKFVPINIRVSSKTTSGLGPGGHAAGGYRAPGVASWVGEKGPELSVPTTGSFIIPTAQSMALAGVAAGAGGGDVNLTLYGRPLEVQSPADVVREMRRAQRLGLPPRHRQPGWKT